MHDEIRIRCMQHQIAAPINLRPRRSANSEGDPGRICSRGDDKVVLKLPVVAVKRQVHTGIDLCGSHSRIKRNISLPSRGIVADQVVHFPAEFVNSPHSRGLICSHQLHSNHASARCLRCDWWILERPKRTGPRGDLRLRFGKNRFRRRQQQSVAFASRQKLHPRIRLPLVRLKKERKVNRLRSPARGRRTRCWFASRTRRLRLRRSHCKKHQKSKQYEGGPSHLETSHNLNSLGVNWANRPNARWEPSGYYVRKRCECCCS